MICYRDKTWCSFKMCKKFNECPTALTEVILSAARKWWETWDVEGDPPICTYLNSEELDCYEEEENGM